MNPLPRQKLREIVDRYGRRAILDNPRRCKALLLDLCGGHKREIFVLVNALEEQVPHDLLASADHLPPVVLIAQLTQRLTANLALADEAARWAVESWAEALGIAVPSSSPATEAQPSGSAPAPATVQRNAAPISTPAPARVTGMGSGRTFTSTQRVDVMCLGQETFGERSNATFSERNVSFGGRINVDWQLLGTTPGSVRVPPSHPVILRAYRLNDARLATLMQEITQFGPIEALDLRDNRAITVVSIELLRHLTDLKALNLSRTGVTDTGLRALYPLQALTKLDLAWCAQISDEGLARIQLLPQLHSLDISHCERITDEGLAHLRTLSHLTILNLEGCKRISNAGLAYLHAIPSLANLNLSHCPQITNNGVRDLDALPNLTTLHLYGCNRITRGVTLLKRRKPDLYVLR